MPVALLFLEVACAPKPADLYGSATALYREGLFSDAMKKAEQGYSALKKDPQSRWFWKFAILSAELELISGTTDRASAFLAAGPPAQFADLTPRYEMLKGHCLSRLNRYLEAQELLKRAIAGAESLGDSETQADAWLHLGSVQIAHGELSASDADFQRAQQLAEANHLDYQDAVALMNRGVIQIKRERYADAIPLIEAAHEIFNRAGAKSLSVAASENIANCYESLGNLNRALLLLEANVVEQKRSGLAAYLSEDYSELGVIHLRMGEKDAAIRYFHEAFEVVTKDAPIQYSSAAGNLANVLQQTGALDEAEHYNQIALKFAEPKDSATIASLTSTQAAIAEQRGQHDQARATYQKALTLGSNTPSVLWQAYAGLAAVYTAKGDFPNADANYSKALSVIASNRADQLKSDYKITFLSNLIRFYQDYVALLMHQGDANRALEIADSSRASVLTEDLLGQSAPNDTALLKQIQNAAKASRSVFLFYWLAPKTSYVWAITGTQSKAVPLVDQRQIAQEVASYRSLIEETKSDPLSPSPSHAGTQLYQDLIAPVAGLIPASSRIVIVPDGVLHNLNFETLIVSTPQPHYWIEDATISVAPSLSILRAGRSSVPSHRSLFLMGDPVTQSTGYPPLPEAALEIANIQRQFPSSTVLTGPKATVDAYPASHPENFSTLHFATHVDANVQSPLDSAIILSPQSGRFSLYARDIAKTPLNADLVTISACRGAGARTLSGEGLVGFAWAFFQARAHNVVTSLWDVYDNSTAQLMNDFYSGVTAGQSYASSLRDAKLKMLHSNYKKPYYWAPFQLYSRTIAASRN